MKKVYEKPLVIIEDFSLSTSIAGDCENITKLPSYGQCGIDFGGDIIFLNAETGCTDELGVDDGSYSGICYHTPTENATLFASG